MTKETKNKSKIILPLAITGVLLVGGVGSCSVVQYNKSKSTTDSDTEEAVEDNENDDFLNNDFNDDADNSKNDKDKNKDKDVELKRDEEGNITFVKREDNTDDYSHLKNVVRDKVEKEEEEVYFTFDDEGNLVASSKKGKDKSNNLLASIDEKQINVPSSKDDDSSNLDDKDTDKDSPRNDSNDSDSNNDNVDIPDDDTENGNNVGDNDDNDKNTGDSDENNDNDVENGNDDNGGSDEDSDDNNDQPDPKPIDKEDLNNAIASAGSLLNKKHRYVTDSWNSFTRAFDRAISARDNNVSQSVVNEATANLWYAINNLEVKPPTLAIGGLDQLEGKDKNITTDRLFKITVDAKDVDGKNLRNRVYLNGLPVFTITGNYSLFLKEGINTVVVETTDSFGGKATEEFEINYVKDVTPELTHSPISNDNVKDGIFTFETEAFDYKKDKLDVIVTHNGNQVVVKDGKVEVELTEGMNHFKLSATDEKHNKTEEIEFEFNYTDDGFIEGDDVEHDEPILNVNGLDESNIEDGKITFTVDATDDYGRNVPAEVIHNGEVVEGSNGSYTVDLTEGDNDFEISMTDSFGNTITEDYHIVYDKEMEEKDPKVNPEISINGIDSDYVSVSDKNFVFTATAIDGNGDEVPVEVFLNSSELVEGNNNEFSFELEEGDNNVSVVATDDYGNTEEKEYIIHYSVDEDENVEDDEDDETNVEDDETDSDEESTEDAEQDEENNVDEEESTEDEVNDESEEGNEEENTVDENDQIQEEVYEEVLVSGEIGNSNKEFNSLEEAKAWAEQEAKKDSSDWKDYEFEVVQLNYHEIDSEGNKVEGTERSTWSVEFTQEKEAPSETEDINTVDEGEDILVTKSTKEVTGKEDEEVVKESEKQEE